MVGKEQFYREDFRAAIGWGLGLGRQQSIALQVPP